MLKNLPLKYLGYRAALDLSILGTELAFVAWRSGGIALADCGITHLRLPSANQRFKYLSIVNDTKYGTAGVDATCVNTGISYPRFQDTLSSYASGEQRIVDSTYTNPSSSSAPQATLPDFNNTLNTYLCDPITITELGVSLPDASTGLVTIEPIKMPAGQYPDTMTYDSDLCENYPSYPPGTNKPSSWSTFDVRSWYDYEYPPWEVQDGSGDTFECTSSFNSGANGWDINGYNAFAQTNCAWRRGMRFTQINIIPGYFDPVINPPECTGPGIQGCNYRVHYITPTCRIVILNQEKLTDIYIDPTMDPRSFVNRFSYGVNTDISLGENGPPSQFVDGNPTHHRIASSAAFSTIGCHDDLKIHVGTTTGGSNTGQLTGRHHLAGADPLVDVVNTTRVQDWEMVFGTNNPTSEYYAIPELNNHFKRYFGPNHTFVD